MKREDTEEIFTHTNTHTHKEKTTKWKRRRKLESQVHKPDTTSGSGSKKGKGESPPRPFKKRTDFWTSGFLNHKRMHFCGCKLPSVHFGTAFPTHI